MSEPLHRALGLTDEELASIVAILGRDPNPLELSMYSVMWSEHCSYKSSRIHLKRLPTEAPWVLVGPGENAGVVDVGDGIAAAIRIESHNHPSAIEPYQGAATGVGGILRDIFTMGARPIAVMDPLRFGPLDDPRSRWIAEGVVSGISGYGNSVGVPNVGGEVVFDRTYKGNPLVNVLCLGVLPVEHLVLAEASGEGNIAVLLGSSTGRDGIGGVSVLASAGFSGDGGEEKRPSVQVGDPFEEKRLIEACLSLYEAGLVVGIQDLGGAGLTCATSETACNAGMGMEVDVDAVPVREPGMQPFEVMTSESQERMLAIVEPGNLDRVLEVCARWEVSAAPIGTVTQPKSLVEPTSANSVETDGRTGNGRTGNGRNGDAVGSLAGTSSGEELDGHERSGRLVIRSSSTGIVHGDVPAASLHEDAPLYDRPRAEPDGRREMLEDDPVAALPAPEDVGSDLVEMLCDLSWVWSQYDHQLFLNTVEAPGGDAAVLRLKDPRSGNDTGRGLALTTDGNHRWCAVDPRRGTAATVAEAMMNLATVGARPLCVVNCLNFGNPEHPEVMWQLSEAIDGMAEACRILEIPVVGGNVSLYNESDGADIDPTPVIGMLGMIDRLVRRPPGVRLVEGGRLLLVGATGPHLAGSRWAWDRDHRGGELPVVDYDLHLRTAEVVRQVAIGDLAQGIHDLSEGGLGLALAEMACRSEVGVRVARVASHVELFSETPSRVLMCVDADRVKAVVSMCEAADVPVLRLGEAGGDRFIVRDLVDVQLATMRDAWQSRLPAALGGGTIQS